MPDLNQGDTPSPQQGDTPSPQQGDTPPTIQQVLETAYYDARVMIQPESLTTALEVENGFGDGLLEFLLREVVFDIDDPADANSPDHWELARTRIATIHAEVTRVCNAIHRHAPD